MPRRASAQHTGKQRTLRWQASTWLPEAETARTIPDAACIGDTCPDVLSVPETVATSNAQAFGLIAEADAAWLSKHAHSITGTAPRSLRTFIADHVAAFT